MKLFQWNRVDALRRYSTGDIIVSAETVDEARAKVIASSGPFWGRHRGFDDCYFDNISGDDMDDWRVFSAKLLLDLEAEPLVIDGAVFIMGSE
jgi:hypothetical protein